MKVVTQGFKDAIRTFGRELDTIVTIGEQTFDKESLNGIIPTFNSGLFCTIMKGVEIDLNVFIPKNSTINVKSGVLVNDTYEYINYGNYKTKDDSQIDEDTSSYKVIAYDKILESMVDYDLGINYPISVRDYWVAIFNELGWNINGIPTTFRNSTKMINQDVHSGIGYTYRDVLDELCMISGVWLVDKNGIPTIVEPTETNENIDETYLSDANVTIKQKVFFNSLVFARAEESDNIYRKDDESILLNGLHEFRIADNQLLSTNDRDLYIDELWEYLQTFNYYSFEVDTIGIMFLEPLDAFNLVVGTNTYPTILLNDETQITQGLKEVLYSDEPEESQTEYKYADTTDRKLNQTYITVNKQEQRINAVVSTQNEQSESIAQLQLNSEEVNIIVSQTSATLEQQQQDITNINTNLNTTNQNVSSLQGTVNNQATEIGNLNTQIGTTNQTVSNLQGTVNTQTGQISNLNGQVETANQNISNLQGTVGEQTESINHLNDDYSQLEQSTNELNTAVIENQNNIASQQTDISNLNSSLSSTNSELTQVKNDLSTANSTINEMKYTFTTDELKIQSTNDPINSALDNQGIRVYNYTTLKTVLNDKGSGFDDLIVTNTAQIGYLKFVKATDENNEPVTDIHHLVSNIQNVEDLL